MRSNAAAKSASSAHSALAGLPSCGHEDGLHRVLAAAARPEPIRPGLEPGLPLGLQRAAARACKRPIGDHGDG